MFYIKICIIVFCLIIRGTTVLDFWSGNKKEGGATNFKEEGNNFEENIGG